MPRGAKKTAHQHNNRHENGIVAPGKRITKQKSNGHINRSADGSPQPHTPPPASTAVTRSHVPDGRTTNFKHASAESEELDGRDSGDISEELASSYNGPPNGLLDRSHRKINVNAAKSPTVHDNSSLSVAFTILWSCPLGDTLAILIFLLSLSPTFVTLINTLFAILTFMPPTTSLSTFPTTFSDVFQGSSGAPSFATIIAMDVLGFVMWLAIWTPLQNLALELAQAVVATTLGGGNSVKNKGSDHTFFCMGVVIISHVARHKWIQNRFFGYDWTVRLASFSDMPLDPAESLSDDLQTSWTFSGWFRVLVTLHILVQGLVHVVRRWYAKRGHTPPALTSKQTDPEASSGSSGRSDAASLTTPSSGAVSTLQEITTKSSLPNARESKEKTNKKRRKRGTYVRSQQPLWAAFAATKVTVYRELDQSKMLQEATRSNATDLRNLGDAPFALEEGRVWVTSIHLSGFSFEASHFCNIEPDPDSAETAKPTIGAGVDQSKPFFVRINGADWSSTVIRKSTKGGSGGVSADQHWDGEVFGLSPSSSYICSFVRCEDGVEIYSASVSTPSSSPPDQETSATVTSPLQTHRPLSPTSPTTTLRNSILACEANLTESQARQKRSKKDNKAASASLKKEIDILNNKIAKIANEEKAHHNRHLQWNQQSRQADEAVAAMSSELESMGCIPAEDLAHWTSRKSDWETERSQYSGAQKELSGCKESAHQERLAVQGESTSTQQKRERLAARATRLHEQLQRLQSANAQGLNERERRDAELAAKAEDRRQNQEKSHALIADYENSIDILQRNIRQNVSQISVFQNAFDQQQTINAAMDDPAISRADLPGTVLPPSTGPIFGFPALGQAEKGALRNQSTSLRHEHRPRSSSLLSGDNGTLNDFDDQDPAPPMPSVKTTGKAKGRNQSGSAGGSGSIRLSPANKSSSPVWN